VRTARLIAAFAVAFFGAWIFKLAMKSMDTMSAAIVYGLVFSSSITSMDYFKAALGRRTSACDRCTCRQRSRRSSVRYQ
jgi:hypothetical protein